MSRRNLISSNRNKSEVTEEYIDNEDESVGEKESGNVEADNLKDLLSGLSGDPFKLYELLVKNISIAINRIDKCYKIGQEVG